MSRIDDRADTPEPGADTDLVAADVSVRFGGVHAIEGVSLRLRAGEILGLIGPNGAGKTTLVNVLSGFQRPHRGDVRIGGRDMSHQPAEDFARRGVARTFQAVRLFQGLTVAENVEVPLLSQGLGRRQARARALGLLELLGLAGKAGLSGAGLSYGDERRVGIARALALQPRFLLVDEPAAGLTPQEADDLALLIADIRTRFRCAVMVIEHNMRFIMALCERIHVLATGQTIAEGTPAAIRGNGLVRAVYLGSDAP